MGALSWVLKTFLLSCRDLFPTAAATVGGLGNLVPVLGMGGLVAAAGEVFSI